MYNDAGKEREKENGTELQNNHLSNDLYISEKLIGSLSLSLSSISLSVSLCLSRSLLRFLVLLYAHSQRTYLLNCIDIDVFCG